MRALLVVTDDEALEAVDVTPGADDEMEGTDTTSASSNHRKRLLDMARAAEQLAGPVHDRKLAKLTAELKALLADGYELVTMADLVGDRADDAMTAYRADYTTRGWAINRTFDGVPELLADLRAAGVRLAVATSKSEPIARRILEHFGLDGFFEHVQIRRQDFAPDDAWLADPLELMPVAVSAPVTA